VRHGRGRPREQGGLENRSAHKTSNGPVLRQQKFQLCHRKQAYLIL
jgi:hypothetical protein